MENISSRGRHHLLKRIDDCVKTERKYLISLDFNPIRSFKVVGVAQ
jgi:hypothetical protein